MASAFFLVMAVVIGAIFLSFAILAVNLQAIRPGLVLVEGFEWLVLFASRANFRLHRPAHRVSSKNIRCVDTDGVRGDC